MTTQGLDFGQVGCAFWRSAARAEAGSKPPQSAQGRPAGQDLLHTRLPATFRHPLGSRPPPDQPGGAPASVSTVISGPIWEDQHGGGGLEPFSDPNSRVRHCVELRMPKTNRPPWAASRSARVVSRWRCFVGTPNSQICVPLAHRTLDILTARSPRAAASRPPH